MWLLEGLLRIPNLTEEDRSALRRLRRATLRRSLRAQAGRLVHRRWTPELPSYLAYRAGIGDQARLHEALDRTGAAEGQRVSPGR